MEQDQLGRVCLTPAEAATVRAALFVAIYHVDGTVGHCPDCFESITGVDLAGLPPLMTQLDEYSGHRSKVDVWLADEMTKLAALSDEQLAASRNRENIVRSAVDRGLLIPPRLQGP